MGIALLVIGAIISSVGGIMIVFVAFRKSIPWGLGCLFFSIVSLIFVIMHWEDTKKPFFIHLAGLPFILVGAAINGNMH